MEISATLRTQARSSVSTRDMLQDGLFLSLVVLLSLILYVRGLGFYSDDWYLMELFSHSSDQSIFGLLRSVYIDATRPVYFLYLTGIYWLFGAHPLAYHVVNALALNTTILLFYLTVRELGGCNQK